VKEETRARERNEAKLIGECDEIRGTNENRGSGRTRIEGMKKEIRSSTTDREIADIGDVSYSKQEQGRKAEAPEFRV